VEGLNFLTETVEAHHKTAEVSKGLEDLAEAPHRQAAEAIANRGSAEAVDVGSADSAHHSSLNRHSSVSQPRLTCQKPRLFLVVCVCKTLITFVCVTDHQKADISL
jgi:hypothetical protein